MVLVARFGCVDGSLKGMIMSKLCPRCTAPLRDSHDMWGPYSLCERCGYATAEHEAVPPPRSQGEVQGRRG